MHAVDTQFAASVETVTLGGEPRLDRSPALRWRVAREARARG
jgi:hypothetical protein